MRTLPLFLTLICMHIDSHAQMINTTPDFVGVEVINASDLDNNDLTEDVASDLVEIECQRIGSKLGSVSINDCQELNLQTTGS